MRFGQFEKHLSIGSAKYSVFLQQKWILNQNNNWGIE